MKSSLFVSTALAALMLVAAVHAQTATGTGTSNSTSNSGSSSGAQGVVGPAGNAVTGGGNAGAASNSNSNSNASTRSQSSGNANAQNINFNSPGNTSSSNNNTNRNYDNSYVGYGGGTSNYNRNDGDVTVRTTPTVYAPPVSGGNPCTLAVSGGVSVIGWGAAAGGTFVDEACATRQKIAMIHNAGYAGAAKELMCDDRASYNAFKTAGQPCAFRAAFEAPGTPPTVAPLPAQPVVVAPTSPVIAPTATRDRATLPRCSRTVTDNCYSG